MAKLLLGPVLRHVGTTTATVWVQTDAACEVTVLGTRARTFAVHGHHYALVDVLGLEPGSSTPYDVHLDGEPAWPREGSALPALRIRTRGGGGPVRVIYGSCRRAKPDDPTLAASLGMDALDVYARRLASLDPAQRPDALLLLGDQVYADDPTPQFRRWLTSRRDTTQPPWEEVADYAEYARLYVESWSDEEVRWLLGTVPTAMIFDDHDVRDDWNTSRAWRDRITATTWWGERIRGGLAAYWVYQHIGNLGPAERATDRIWQQVRAAAAEGTDAGPLLDRMADAADRDPTTIGWSYRWELGGVRLVMVDTRCGRVLDEDARAMLDDAEFRWVEEAVSGPGDAGRVEHLLVGSSLPWLMPPAIHDVQAITSDACARGSARAEKIRQGVDLEHWAAFRGSFERLAGLLHRVAAAPDAPATISVLSGDVHHSYAAQVRFGSPVRSKVYQLVCSPVHHALPKHAVAALRLAWTRPIAGLLRGIARRRGIPDPSVHWWRRTGSYFGNALSTLVLDGRDAGLTIEGAVAKGPTPALHAVERVTLAGAGGHSPTS